MAILLALCVMQARAEETRPTADLLHGLSARVGMGCDLAKLGVARPGDKPGALDAAQLQANMLCDCVPRQIDKVRQSLAAGKMPSHLSAEDFRKLVQPVVDHTCMAEQMRVRYQDGCAKRFAGETEDSTSYCGCMASRMARLSDSDIAAMATAGHEDFERAVAAQRAGLPRPEKSDVSRRAAQMDAACKAVPPSP